MPAPTSTAPRVPRLLQRRAARGSALGMGLLVASGVAAPAALADEDPATGDAVLQTPDAVDQVPVGDLLEQWEPADLPADLVADFGVGKTLMGPALTVGIVPDGPVPDDLDLSGAVLAFRDVAAEGEGLAAYCVTDEAGTCTVQPEDLLDLGLAEETGSEETGSEELPEADSSRIALGDGTYVVEQVAGSPGLAPSVGILATFEMGCPGAEAPFCAVFGHQVPISNASLFHTALTTTVVDAETGDPLAGAGYRLTGPAYPQLAGSEVVDDCQDVLVPEEELPVPPPGLFPFPSPLLQAEQLPSGTDAPTGTTDTREALPGDVDPESLTVATSGEDGVLTHVGCLLPGTWTLEPVSTPEGYEPATAEVVLGSPWDAASETWNRLAGTTVELSLPVVTPPTSTPPTTTPPPTTPPTSTPPTSTPPTTATPDTGTETTPSTTTAPVPPTSAPAPVPTGTGGTGTGTGGTGTGGTGAGAARPANGAGSAPAAVPSAAPTAAPSTAAALPTGTPRPTTARPTTVAAPEVEAAPALETRSSTNYLQVGLVGFGVLFTGLVFFLVLLLRRRAREQRG